MPARQSPKYGWFMFINPAGWSGNIKLRIITQNRINYIIHFILH